jgi:hypothetical protein
MKLSLRFWVGPHRNPKPWADLPVQVATKCEFASAITARDRRRSDRINLSHCVNWRWRKVDMGQFLPRHLTERAATLPHKAAAPTVRNRGSYGPIVLQKSKVAGLRIFAKNPKQETIADSYDLNRATEFTYEFNVAR